MNLKEDDMEIPPVTYIMKNYKKNAYRIDGQVLESFHPNSYMVSESKTLSGLLNLSIEDSNVLFSVILEEITHHNFNTFSGMRELIVSIENAVVEKVNTFTSFRIRDLVKVYSYLSSLDKVLNELLTTANNEAEDKLSSIDKLDDMIVGISYGYLSEVNVYYISGEKMKIDILFSVCWSGERNEIKDK
jgi:hypothetical protein